MFAQIFWGSLLLGVCAILHIGVLVAAIPSIKAIRKRFTSTVRLFHGGVLIAITIAFVVFSHTIQVWLWAFCLIALGALPDLEQAIYFSLSTYTTVGYGDVTLGPEFRTFGAMASVTGLLAFGISTAFLVAFIEQLLQKTDL